jgi:hypothetical protein
MGNPRGLESWRTTTQSFRPFPHGHSNMASAGAVALQQPTRLLKRTGTHLSSAAYGRLQCPFIQLNGPVTKEARGSLEHESHFLQAPDLTSSEIVRGMFGIRLFQIIPTSACYYSELRSSIPSYLGVQFLLT